MPNFEEIPDDSLKNKTDENQENLEQTDLNSEEIILQNQPQVKIISQVDITQRKEEDAKKIQEIKEQLGLTSEESKEQPTSSEKPIENNENKETGEIIINKEKITDLIDTGRKLVYAFHKREENEFNPLIEEKYISQLAASLNDLNILFEDNKQPINAEDFNNTTVKITNIIKNIDNTPRAQSMHGDIENDIESLGKIIFFLKEMEEKTHNIASSLFGEKEERPEETLNILRKLEDAARDGWLFIASKRTALSRYK